MLVCRLPESSAFCPRYTPLRVSIGLWGDAALDYRFALLRNQDDCLAIEHSGVQSSIVATPCDSCGGTRPLRGQAPPSPPLSRAKGRAFSNKELKMGLFGRGRRTPQRGTSPLPGWFLCPPPVPASSSRWLPCWIFLESSTLKLHFVGVAAGLRFSQRPSD